MADVSITATNVVKGTGAVVAPVRSAGETITAGQAIRLSASNGKVYKADSDTGTASDAAAIGIALNGGAADQPIQYCTQGPVTLGAATLTAGQFYFLSNTAGGICPFADLGTADKVTCVGYAESTSSLYVFPIVTNVSLA